MARGEVFAVRIETGSDGTGIAPGFGGIRIFRSLETPRPASCRQLLTASSRTPITELDYSFENAPNQMRLQARSGGTQWICFEPNGRASDIGGRAHSFPNGCSGETYAFYMARENVSGGLFCGAADEADSASKNYWRVSVSYSGSIRITDRNWP